MAFRWEALDSVIFETTNLEDIRAFYERLLGFPIARYEKEGSVIEDVTPQHVNYRIGSSLVGFELGPKADTGSIVVRVADLANFRKGLDGRLSFAKSESFFVSLADPDGREVIVEENRGGGIDKP